MEVGEELLQMNSGCSKSPDPSKSEGSQTDRILSDLLKRSSTPLHYKEYEDSSFVFWSENEGSENNSSSGNQLNTIQHKIKSVFSNIDPYQLCIGEFWAPVTINERRLLSTSGQPFYINSLTKEWVMYRLNSEKHQYDIDVNKLQIEGDPNIRRGGPATSFLRRLSNLDHLPASESCFGLKIYTTLPICFPSDQSDCIGVLVLIYKDENDVMWPFLVSDALEALKKVELDICNVQQHIPYEKSETFKYIEIEKQTINGLRQTKDEITYALKMVCESHKLHMGHVWGAFEDKSHVPLSTYLEDTQRIFGLKLTDYHRYLHNIFDSNDMYILELYNRFCDIFPLERTSKERDLMAIQDFKPRYTSAIRDDDLLLKWENLNVRHCAFAICMRSVATGDFSFLLEFIWPNYSKDSRCDVFLEAIKCLPSFKFASGAEIGNKLEVIEVECYKEGRNTSFKLFQGKQPIVVGNIAPSKVACQTTSRVLHPKDMDNLLLDVICVTNPTLKPKANHKKAKIFLTRVVIEKQFGKTMNEAAHNLKGPNLLKRKANDLCPVQNTTNEANETTQGPVTVNINKHIVFLKAEYTDDMIKFNLPLSQATFTTIEKTISVKFKLSVGTFKLKYHDEDGDWIIGY
ncbi:hypothetical protein R6Q59_031177 [Mikania micrantha]